MLAKDKATMEDANAIIFLPVAQKKDEIKNYNNLIYLGWGR